MSTDAFMAVGIFLILAGAVGLVALFLTRDKDDAIPMSFEELVAASEAMHPVTCRCPDCRIDYILAARATHEIDLLQLQFELPYAIPRGGLREGTARPTHKGASHDTAERGTRSRRLPQHRRLSGGFFWTGRARRGRHRLGGA